MKTFRISMIGSLAAAFVAGNVWADVMPMDDSSLSDVSGLNNNGIFTYRTTEADKKKSEEELAEMRSSLRQSAAGTNDFVNKENTDRNLLDRQQLPNYDASRDGWRDVMAGSGGDANMKVGQGNNSNTNTNLFGGNSLGGLAGGGMDWSGTRSRVLINTK